MVLLNALLEDLGSVTPRFFAKLKKLGIRTVRDLLWHFPARYEDFSQIYKIADLIPGQEATIQGEIKEVGGRRTWRRHLYLVEALVSDESGSIRAVWFNQPYVKNILRLGRIANFSGKVTRSGDELYLSNPAYELLSWHAHHETKHTGRIVPIYPETKGLTSKGIRYLLKPILDEVARLEDIVPKEILARENLPEINRALRDIHFPNRLEDALEAKRRFAFDDLFLLQLHNLEQKFRLARTKAVPIKIDLEEVKQILRNLPFELTLSQKKSLWEIIQSLERPHPMNRLLQGDVGSGKTIIAAIAALEVARAGCQTAFMAPTEILARQHYKTISKFFPEFGGGVALLTSSEAKMAYGHNLEADAQKKKLLGAIAGGEVKIIIGTHALIQKGVKFQKLALVVVDEQHRFGVEQRAALTRHDDDNRDNDNDYDKKPASSSLSSLSSVPHFLSMSATPIPRTLSLTLFGDLDLSLITELPKNRKPIITKAIDPKNREKTYAFIRAEVKKGRQVFVICPRIEQGGEVQPSQIDGNVWRSNLQSLEMKSVKEEYEKLSKKIFPDLRVQMLHGKIPAKTGPASRGKPTKEGVMKDFTEGKIDILVATSVIEVGIDIPNATIMMIESAERFGLAQLYQFRGRVGRGADQSYCLLFTDSTYKSARDRLRSIVEAKNGFELAEHDLKMRGPGEFLGRVQTGMPDLAMKAIQNPELVKTAREAAHAILKKSPNLENHPALKRRLEEFQREVHKE